MSRVGLKARLHMRFLMRFLMRFRVRNVPDPTLHESLFREASCGLERKVSHIIWRHPSFEFLPTWRYFVTALRDYKPVRGRLGQVLYAKSHQNRIEIAWKIACINGPLGTHLQKNSGKHGLSLAKMWPWSNSSQVGGQTIPNSIHAECTIWSGHHVHTCRSTILLSRGRVSTCDRNWSMASNMFCWALFLWLTSSDKTSWRGRLVRHTYNSNRTTKQTRGHWGNISVSGLNIGGGGGGSSVAFPVSSDWLLLCPVPSDWLLLCPVPSNWLLLCLVLSDWL